MFRSHALRLLPCFPPGLLTTNALRSVAVALWIDRSGFKVPDSWAPEVGSRGGVTPIQRSVTKTSRHSVRTVPPLAICARLRVASQEAHGAQVDQRLPGRVDRDPATVGDVPLSGMPLGRHLESTRGRGSARIACAWPWWSPKWCRSRKIWTVRARMTKEKSPRQQPCRHGPRRAE
jgi:hypothetical protein